MKMKNLLITFAIALLLQLQPACAQSSIITPKVAPYPGSAPNVTTFSAACPAATAANLSALNTFVFTLSSQGIWSKMIAVYPFVGGSAACHKLNLVNAADTTYQMLFNGSPTHSGAGVTFNAGESGNSQFVISTAGYGNAISAGAKANTVQNGDSPFGALDATRFALTYNSGGIINGAIGNGGQNSTGGFPNSGFFSGGNDAGTAKVYQNGGQVAFSAMSGGLVVWPLLFHGLCNNGAWPACPSNNFGAATYTFAYVGKSLTDTEMNNLATAVNTLQVALGGR
jgi:hypothetical protein